MTNKEEQLSSDVSIDRDALYQLVWAEPMLKVAARFGVSSSYMARVCAALSVPRPAAGYWGKAAVGRAPPAPALPPARPGEQLSWIKGEAVSTPAQGERSSSDAENSAQRRLTSDESGCRAIKAEKASVHHIVSGAKAHFEKGRFSHELGYLKPDKKTLVDLIVTPATLDRALTFANGLFQALESRQHRVLFERDYEESHRRAPDVLERPPGPLDSYTNLWSPSYPTVVFVGTVGFGLTIVEMAEEALARYVDGKYIRDSEYQPPKRRYRHDATWTIKRQFPTGRLRLQVYSAFRGTHWMRHWDENDQPLDSMIQVFVTTLEKSVSEVTKQIDETIRKLEVQRQEWEVQREKWRREEEQRLIAEAQKQSHDELRRIMSAWIEARDREAFFKDVERRAAEISGDRREQLLGQLKRGRTLVSTTDVLDQFARWRSPEERLEPQRLLAARASS